MGGDDVENREGRAKRNSNGVNIASSTYMMEDRESKWTSWLVPMFVVANVAVFIIVMHLNDCPKNSRTRPVVGRCVARFLGRFSFQPLRENPLFGPSSSTLQKLGALEWSKVVVNHQGWRLITCIWLHAGVIHLLENMLSLVFIGIRLEQQFGFARIGILYLLSGFGGSVLSSLFIRNSISVGASGALFGLLGAMLSELITNWTIYTNKASALLTLLVIIVINLAVGILPHVGWFESRNVPLGSRLKSKYKPYQYVLWVASMVLLLAGLGVALTVLFRGEDGNEHCSWCHYVSCVPTSRWECEQNN
ncbi:homeobox-leucine zipper protein ANTHOCYANINLESS 2-like isoform X1 [Hibiscus syriacus]|uniref:RHOMBOID-like protein n=1 Tax=Hibiscus syriacus TaxID=106335 RepID=A0A6A3B3N1_HIBSY|nr:homeobox-leucine zipper protein ANTHOCYANINLESS 2-like isoform X1 [Hibiscus syriacus]